MKLEVFRSARFLVPLSCAYLILSGCAETPARTTAVAAPTEIDAPKPPPARPVGETPRPSTPTAGVPVVVQSRPAAPVEPESPAAPEPPPDLAFSMAADDPRPPASADIALAALVAKMKKSNNLSMRLTLLAPPVASREYALGLAAKTSETLRRHLRGLGVPPRKIIRVVIDPRRATVANDERIDVEIRLIGGK